MQYFSDEQLDDMFGMLDLEQFIGKKIHWVSGKTFDEVLNASYNNLLPSALRRYCTTEMKMQPIFEWWLENIIYTN